MIGDLDVVPRQKVKYRGSALEEMDFTGLPSLGCLHWAALAP